MLLQLLLVDNPYLKQDDYKDQYERQSSIAHKAYKDGDFLFIGRGYEMDSFWIDGTLTSMKERLDNIVKVEKKDNNA